MTDGQIGADLEIGPAQLAFDLFVALLHPVPQTVEAGDLGQIRWRVRTVGFAE
ncbi:hypothetical protein [Nocardia terpenica]|uniref:hypothetical protein n=1 Tax=Nocardia terpenica TaxID=455432 RepID=UPI001EE9FE57|nr:hypothetical protein [Nocardia terpenica]